MVLMVMSHNGVDEDVIDMYEMMFDFQQDNGFDDDVIDLACMK